MKENKKETYERPLLQVFELKPTADLLTLSNLSDYVDGGDPLSSRAISFEDEDIVIE